MYKVWKILFERWMWCRRTFDIIEGMANVMSYLFVLQSSVHNDNIAKGMNHAMSYSFLPRTAPVICQSMMI